MENTTTNQDAASPAITTLSDKDISMFLAVYASAMKELLIHAGDSLEDKIHAFESLVHTTKKVVASGLISEDKARISFAALGYALGTSIVNELDPSNAADLCQLAASSMEQLAEKLGDEKFLNSAILFKVSTTSSDSDERKMSIVGYPVPFPSANKAD